MVSSLAKVATLRKRSPYLWLGVLLMCVVAGSRNARAQTTGAINYEGEKVTAIDLASRPEADVGFLRDLIVQQVGQPYSNAKIQQSIAALLGTGEFSSAKVQVMPDNGGLRLLFILEPAYYLGLVEFPGAVPPFPYTRLRQVVAFSEGSPFFQEEMKDAAGAVRTFLPRNGFFAATVTTRTEIDKEHKLVNPIFDVTLNRRAKVGTIEFDGLSEPEAERVRGALGSFWTHFEQGRLKKGTTFTEGRIQAAINRIRRTLGAQHRLAQEISLESARYEPDTNRANLLFHVKLGPTVTVQVQGAHVWGRTLKKLIPIYQENSYDSDLLAEGRMDLANYFQSKGYFDVQVASEVQREPDRVDIVYRVDKGKKHSVEKISFSGNHAFTNAQLQAAVVIHKEKFLVSRGRFSETLLRASVGKIVNMYKVRGFPDVHVDTRVQDTEPNVYITFNITEGMQALVHHFEITGDAGLDPSKLPAHGFRLNTGRAYSPEYEQEDRNDILAYYLDRGYLSAQLKSSATPVNGNKYQMDVMYEVEPGKQTVVGNVVYLGNTTTKTSLIAHTAALSPETPLSASKMLAAESDLYNLGIFDWTNVGPREAQSVTAQVVEANPGADPPGDTSTGLGDRSGGAQSSAAGNSEDPPQEANFSAEQNRGINGSQNDAEVLVKVHESQKNSIDYGGGLELVSRGGSPPGGALVVPGLAPIPVGRNFSTSEQRFFSPIGTFAYTRRNLWGRGQTFTGSLLGSRLDNRATLTYGFPRLWSTNWSALASGNGERSTLNPIFAETLGSGSFQVQRNLDVQRTQTLIFRYVFQHTALSNLLIPSLVLPEDQNVRLSTLSVSYVRDTRDKPLDAHHGIYQTFDFGVTSTALGASASFARFLGQTAYYVPVTPHITWANNVRLGFAKPIFSSRVPVSEEFFSGGSDTLRGFPIDGAGPQRPVVACGNTSNPSTCSTISVPVGGNMLLVVNSELRFPIPLKEGLGAAVFYDGGNVYARVNLPLLAEKYTNSVGIGFRYQTPVGPVRFDIGHLLNPIAGISSVQFFLTLGQAF